MFKLMRYFSIASAVTIALAMIAVSTVVTDITTTQLIHEREAAGRTLAQSFSNALWPRYRGHLETAVALDAEGLRGAVENRRFAEDMRGLVSGLTVVRVDVVAPNGKTVFTTDANRLGQETKDYAGFVAAARGQVQSEIAHHGRFQALQGTLGNIDTVTSFLPIRGEGRAIEGVFAVTYDITKTLEAVRHQRYSLIATVSLLFVVLYMILQMIVGHAAKVMGRQHEELTLAKSALETSNKDLAEEISIREHAQTELQTTYEQLVDRTDELQAAQDSLVQKERLATLGQLTATVSHELRNPMGAIRTSLFLAKQKTEGKGLGVERALDRAERNIVRCDGIIAELLDFARDTPPNLEPEIADRWLRLTLVEQPLPEGVEVDYDFGASDVEVVFDKERLRRAVINVFDNGAQAMIDNPPERTRQLKVSTQVLDDHYLMVFEDQGSGMDAETLEKIFEPLFSTKSFGVGLGLPTVKKIIEVHGGEISYDSTLDVGTKATIRLPIKSKQQEAA